MKSRSHFCVRKVQDLAKKSNCKMIVPDEKRANEIIDEANKRMSGIIHGYDGNPTSSRSNFEPLRDIGIAMDAGGRFLDQLESKYTDACVEDITITSIEPEKEGEEPTELVETGHLGIKVEEIKESCASKEDWKRYFIITKLFMIRDLRHLECIDSFTNGLMGRQM